VKIEVHWDFRSCSNPSLDDDKIQFYETSTTEEGKEAENFVSDSVYKPKSYFHSNSIFRFCITKVICEFIFTNDLVNVNQFQ
jgi:hypothetical protein